MEEGHTGSKNSKDFIDPTLIGIFALIAFILSLTSYIEPRVIPISMVFYVSSIIFIAVFISPQDGEN